MKCQQGIAAQHKKNPLKAGFFMREGMAHAALRLKSRKRKPISIKAPK